MRTALIALLVVATGGAAWSGPLPPDTRASAWAASRARTETNQAALRAAKAKTPPPQTAPQEAERPCQDAPKAPETCPARKPER